MFNQPRKSRRSVVKPVAPTPLRITGATVSSPSLVVTFDQPVKLTGLPGWGVDAGTGTVTQANQPNPNQVELVFSDAITGATQIIIPFRDTTIQSSAGGFVADSLYLIAA